MTALKDIGMKAGDLDEAAELANPRPRQQPRTHNPQGRSRPAGRRLSRHDRQQPRRQCSPRHLVRTHHFVFRNAMPIMRSIPRPLRPEEPGHHHRGEHQEGDIEECSGVPLEPLCDRSHRVAARMMPNAPNGQFQCSPRRPL